MADLGLTVHVVFCACSETELVERMTAIIAEHVAHAREGAVPALLAEDLVATLRAQHSLCLVSDVDGDG